MLILNFIWDNKTSCGSGAVLIRFSTPKTMFSVYSRFKLLWDKGIIYHSFGSGTMETVQVDLIYPAQTYYIVLLNCQLISKWAYAATYFMPEIESAVMCLLYCGQNKGWETGLLWLPSSLRI